jgi:predicted HicB family RNase H-like nuclease
MRYKNYIGEVKYDDEDRIFHGRVINISKDIISFQGSTVDKLEADFRKAVDFYIKMKKENGESPEEPFSGKFIVRLNTELHGAAVEEAARRNISLNKLVEQAIENEVQN